MEDKAGKGGGAENRLSEETGGGEYSGHRAAGAKMCQ